MEPRRQTIWVYIYGDDGRRPAGTAAVLAGNFGPQADVKAAMNNLLILWLVAHDTSESAAPAPVVVLPPTSVPGYRPLGTIYQDDLGGRWLRVPPPPPEEGSACGANAAMRMWPDPAVAAAATVVAAAVEERKNGRVVI